MELSKDCKDFFKDLRSDTAFNEMPCDARELGDEIDILANFKNTQPRHRTGQLETVNNSTSTGKTSRVLLVSDGKEAVSYSKACCAICGMESTGVYLCDTQYVEIR
ncbi:hypothetical protein TNCV_2221121 [Trichonephila clavipes]|nr:hypothetical protein TNCV_2221121 [Trichonephila clavipes]